MSKQSTINLKCPKCGLEHPVTIWESLETDVDAEFKDSVIDRSLFMAECPGCGEKTEIEQDFLYVHKERKWKIYYACTDESEKKILTELGESDVKDGYRIRVVSSKNELLEKIFILDAGLDDRIVELCKIYVLAAYQEEHPGCKIVELYFFTRDGGNCLQVIADGRPSGVVNLSEMLYSGMQRDYSGKLGYKGNRKYFIDRQWALDTMGVE